jgi:hypothetical protein
MRKQRVKAKAPSQADIEIIKRMIKTDSIPMICKAIDNTPWQVNRVVHQLIYFKDLEHPAEDPGPIEYYRTEDEIMEALTLEYDYRDLRGEELEIFKNIL